ncbi:MAG TPA: NAD(P)/FAD-dependent oxidoreductase [Cyclobacteriaceae bacterium]
MKNLTFDLIVIGGGAAGFFGAICTAEKKPGLKVLILEKTTKLLSKVRVSGGGRCNVTNNCFEASALSRHYPRGEKPLKQLFKSFQARDTVEWFQSKGVTIVAEEDGRMFPITDSSQTIIDCFLAEANRLKIQIEINEGVVALKKEEELFSVITQSETTYRTKKILVATGGHANPNAYQFLDSLGHTIIKPIPSLFTFNDSIKDFKDLMGVAVQHAEVKIAGTKLSQTGPVLITHWGLSGPAVIKLSAWAAEHLHQLNYNFTALVSWIGSYKEDDIREYLLNYKKDHGKQKVFSNPLFGLPQRLWLRLVSLAEIEETKIWAELPQKNINKLMEFMIRCSFQIRGKTTFKDEFVTCGGVDLKEINLETMESKLIKNIFFAGEVTNVDGETGGYNFQAAWTTAYVASLYIAQ